MDVMAVLWHVADGTFLGDTARGCVGHVEVVHVYGAGGGRAQACDHFDQLCLSVALDAGDADDFPAAHVERDAAQGRLAKIIGRLQVVDLQEHFARSCRPPDSAFLHTVNKSEERQF